MGWYYTNGASKTDIVRELTEMDDNGTARIRTLRHCLRDNVLWALVEVERYGAEPSDSKRYIACYLLQRGDNGWGYKPMSESMHPYYYSCPLSYLNACPETNRDWRAEVRSRHQKKHLRRKVIHEAISRMGTHCN